MRLQFLRSFEIFFFFFYWLIYCKCVYARYLYVCIKMHFVKKKESIKRESERKKSVVDSTLMYDLYSFEVQHCMNEKKMKKFVYNVVYLRKKMLAVLPCIFVHSARVEMHCRESRFFLVHLLFFFVQSVDINANLARFLYSISFSLSNRSFINLKNF